MLAILSCQDTFVCIPEPTNKQQHLARVNVICHSILAPIASTPTSLILDGERERASERMESVWAKPEFKEWCCLGPPVAGLKKEEEEEVAEALGGSQQEHRKHQGEAKRPLIRRDTSLQGRMGPILKLKQAPKRPTTSHHQKSKAKLKARRQLTTILALVIATSALLPREVSAVWPFNVLAQSGSRLRASLGTPRLAAAVSSGPNASADYSVLQQQIQQPLMSQQFHYFWNHDQIEPQVVTGEASKVLQEAQLQTNQLQQQSAPRSSSSSAPAKQDPMLGSASESLAASSPQLLIPAAIQQQLTGMVLQLQRQQQASMMMQPRFDPISAQRRLQMGSAAAATSPALVGTSRGFWPPATVPLFQPTTAMNPLNMNMNMNMNMMAAESAPSGVVASLSPHAVMMQAPRLAPAGTMAGVPIYGPFMVAPGAPHMPLPAPMVAGVSQPAAAASVARSAVSLSPSAKALTTSHRRHSSWPFSLASLGSGGERQVAAASQPRAVIVLPPPFQVAANSRAVANQVPKSLPESLAQVEASSARLAQAVAAHLQARVNHQKLANQAIGVHENSSQIDSNQAASSSLEPKYLAYQGKRLVQPQTTTANHLRAPYLMPADLFGTAAQMAIELAATAAANGSSVLDAQVDLIASGPPNSIWGGRLKRRHSSSGSNRTSVTSSPSPAANPPYTVVLDGSPRPLIQVDEHASNQQAEKHENKIQIKDANEQTRKPHGSRSQAESKLRQLFMVLATESPPLSDDNLGMSGSEPSDYSQVDVSGDDSSLVGGQTQLRRLKRSSSGWIPSGSSIKPLVTSALQIDNEPTSSSNYWPKNPNSFKFKPMQGKGSWSALELITTKASIDQQLLKRQAEMLATTSTTSNNDRGTSKLDQQTVANGGDSANNQTFRQDRSFKIKRISASASVIHHPSVTTAGLSHHHHYHRNPAFFEPLMNNLDHKTTTTSTSTTTTTTTTTPKPISPTSWQEIDPMSASLSESARVVNYFQNVDNETTSKPSNSVVAQPQQQSSNLNNQNTQNIQNRQPTINVGFGAPNIKTSYSMSVRVSDSKGLSHNINLPPGNQGNGFGAGGDYSGGSQTDGRLRGGQQQQQQLAAANNNNAADISSSATRSVAYTVNAGASNMATGHASLPGQLAVPGIGQTGSSSHARADYTARQAGNSLSSNSPSSSSSLAMQAKLLAALLSQSNHLARNSSPSSSSSILSPSSGGFGSLVRVQTTSPPTTSSTTGATNSNFDRSPSADQSSQYTDEMIAPPPPAHSSSSNGFLSDMTGNQQSTGGGGGLFSTSASDEGSTDSNNVVSNGITQDMQTGSLSFSDNSNQNNNFDNNRLASQDAPMADQMMDLARFNQQQSPSSAFNQTAGLTTTGGGGIGGSTSSGSVSVSDNLIASDGTPIDGTTSQLFGGQQQQQQQATNSILPFAHQQQRNHHQSTTNNEDVVQTLGPPAGSGLNQQQFYSQQLQALGAAVNKYNQHRFQQQLQDAALQIPNFNSPSSHQQNFHAPSNNFNSYQNATMAATSPWQTVDEEAMAGALAAAGIPFANQNPAQLFAQLQQGQHQQHQINELSNMVMASSEQARSEQEEMIGEGGGKSSKQKKKSNKVPKQVSHHYHINNFGASPFEEPESHYSPLDIATALATPPVGVGMFRPPRPGKSQKEVGKEEEKKEEEEEEKPKKKKGGFLRRFSLKNWLKKLKKDKKKNNGGQEEQPSGGSDSSDR